MAPPNTRQVTKTVVGTKVTIRVIRDGHEKDVTVTIGEHPDSTKVAKVESGETDYAFAGVAVQDLDRETAKELGVKGKAQIRAVVGLPAYIKEGPQTAKLKQTNQEFKMIICKLNLS